METFSETPTSRHQLPLPSFPPSLLPLLPPFHSLSQLSAPLRHHLRPLTCGRLQLNAHSSYARCYTQGGTASTSPFPSACHAPLPAPCWTCVCSLSICIRHVYACMPESSAGVIDKLLANDRWLFVMVKRPLRA